VLFSIVAFAAVLFIDLFFVFSPCGRKNEEQKIWSTLLPFVLSLWKLRPELAEGGRLKSA
jgi:hypothetical protein